MRISIRMKLAGAALAGVGIWQFVGCGGILPQITVPVRLGGSGTFDVQPGVPVTKNLTATFDTGNLTVGSGSVAVDPSLMTVNRASAKTTQAATGCSDACGQAGLSAAECSQICADGEVHVIVLIGAGDEESTVCTTGERYPPQDQADAFRVTLVNDVPTSVTPDSISFQPRTLQALNDGSASFCVTVIAGFSGQVILDQVTLTAGL